MPDTQLKVTLLGQVRRTPSGQSIPRGRAIEVARQFEQVAANGEIPVVLDERPFDLVQDREASLRPVRHRGGDGAVEGDHLVAGQLFQKTVEGLDLGPIGVFCARRVIVDRRDRCLELVLWPVPFSDD